MDLTENNSLRDTLGSITKTGTGNKTVQVLHSFISEVSPCIMRIPVILKIEHY